jgi:hypothetical protein
MANLKGSGKGGRKRIYQEADEKLRLKLSMEKYYEGKRKVNFVIPEAEYQRFVKIEQENGFKFHADFLKELMDVYESTAQLRKMMLNKTEKAITQ